MGWTSQEFSKCTDCSQLWTIDLMIEDGDDQDGERVRGDVVDVVDNDDNDDDDKPGLQCKDCPFLLACRRDQLRLLKALCPNKFCDGQRSWA